MSLGVSKRRTSAVLGAWFLFTVGLAFGQDPTSELVVQYDQPLIEGSGGPIAGLSILIPEMVSLFSSNGVEEVSLIFDDFPTEKTINGHIVEMPSFANYYKISCVDEENAGALKDQLELEPSVYTVGSNAMPMVPFSCDSPNDPLFEQQWYLSGAEHSIGVELAWEIACGSGNDTTSIAIIDLPVEYIDEGNPDELTCNGNADLDVFYHGTEVFAIIAAETNSTGISGIGRDLTKYSYVTEGYTVEQFTLDLQEIIEVHGCEVICTSSGLTGEYGVYDPDNDFRYNLLPQFLYVRKNGVLFVASSGQPGGQDDPGMNHISYPAGFGRSVMAVGAFKEDGEFAPWANYGPMLDVVAPGENILTYHGNEPNTDYLNGTSYSQPIVTGIACLMHKVRPDLVAEDYENIIKAFCKDDADTVGFDVKYGWGRIDGGRSVANLIGTYEVEKGQITTVGVVSSITPMTTKFLGFEEQNLFFNQNYNVNMVEIRHQINWVTSYEDSVFAWGNVAGTVGLEPVTNYYDNRPNTPVPCVTTLEYCEPDRNTISTTGSEFVTYGYIVYETADRLIEIARLGPTGPDQASFAYGVIGKKTYDPNPAPEISPTAEYPILTGGTDQSIFAVHIENNGSGTMAATADLTILGGDDPIAQLLDNGEEPDLVADDWIFTSAKFTSTSTPGNSLVTVTAQGDVGPETQQDVVVEVFDSGVLFVDGSDDTDELTQLLGDPYAGIYFDSPVDGYDQNILLITKDSGDEPEIFRMTQIINGSPAMEKNNDSWFQLGSEPNQGSRGVFAADFDNDGDEDFFICHNNQQTKLYQNTGTGFVDSTSYYFGINEVFLEGAHVAAWGDYNQDGKLDLFVATMEYTGSVKDLATNINSAINPHWFLFKNTGASFELVPEVMDIEGGRALSASWNDVNNDGLLDLVVGEIQDLSSESPTVIINQGYKKNLGHYVLEEESGMSQVSGISINSMDWIDYNHDDLPDLIVTEFDTLSGAYILENTPSGFAIADTLDGDKSWTGSVVSDYDLDGQDDIVLLPYNNGMPMLFLSDPSGQSYKELSYPLGLWTGESSGGFAADFNSDGDPDLYLGRKNTDEFLYKNERVDGTGVPSPGGQNWIRFNLETLGNCNASMIGTRVKVDDGIQQWTQTVGGGSGRGGQRSNELHFGLGSVTGTVEVIVDWPGSLPSNPVTFSAMAINTTHILTDNAIPQIISGSSEFLPEPTPGGADWVFEWKTVEHGNVELDNVEINFGDYFPGDYCWVGSNVTLEFGDPDVEMSIFPVLPSGWKHRVVWSDQSCLGDEICSFQFQVGSGVKSPQGVETLTDGPWVNFGEFDVCIIKKIIAN